jgi:dUTP pyrophosphatase
VDGVRIRTKEAALVVMVRLNPVVDTDLGKQLVDLWSRVVNTGGTVGFAAPVTPEEVRPVADRAFARAAARLVDLAVAFDGATPVGMGFLDQGEAPLQTHLGTVRRLMRDPRASGAGIGTSVRAALETAARRRGVERLVVEVRGGQQRREDFYRAHGYRVDGILPDRVRVGGRLMEMVHMSKALNDGIGTADGSTARRLSLAVQRLDEGLPLPRYATEGDAGLDLCSRESIVLQPGARAVIPTGVAVAIPGGHVGLVHPRSGLAARSGLGLVNAPGTIDAGYRGEIKVIAINHDPVEAITIERGDRIAQLLVQQVESVQLDVVEQLPSTVRGTGGFGSTGR